MPIALLRFLPHLGIALAIVGAVWWIDHQGYGRAMADRDARDARMLDMLRIALRDSEQRLARSIGQIEGDYQLRHDAILRAGTALQPIIVKETAHDPRLSDPALGLTPGLLDAVNRARATGPCAATVAGRIDCALPAASTGPGPDDR